MAAGEFSITPEASAVAMEARISPSAAITLARAARPASASAAMVLRRESGSLASLLNKSIT